MERQGRTHAVSVADTDCGVFGGTVGRTSGGPAERNRHGESAGGTVSENASPEWFSDTVQALADYLTPGDDQPNYEALALVRGNDGKPG